MIRETRCLKWKSGKWTAPAPCRVPQAKCLHRQSLNEVSRSSSAVSRHDRESGEGWANCGSRAAPEYCQVVVLMVNHLHVKVSGFFGVLCCCFFSVLRNVHVKRAVAISADLRVEKDIKWVRWNDWYIEIDRYPFRQPLTRIKLATLYKPVTSRSPTDWLFVTCFSWRSWVVCWSTCAAWSLVAWWSSFHPTTMSSVCPAIGSSPVFKPGWRLGRRCVQYPTRQFAPFLPSVLISLQPTCTESNTKKVQTNAYLIWHVHSIKKFGDIPFMKPQKDT